MPAPGSGPAGGWSAGPCLSNFDAVLSSSSPLRESISEPIGTVATPLIGTKPADRRLLGGARVGLGDLRALRQLDEHLAADRGDLRVRARDHRARPRAAGCRTRRRPCRRRRRPGRGSPPRGSCRSRPGCRPRRCPWGPDDAAGRRRRGARSRLTRRPRRRCAGDAVGGDEAAPRDVRARERRSRRLTRRDPVLAASRRSSCRPGVRARRRRVNVTVRPADRLAVLGHRRGDRLRAAHRRRRRRPRARSRPPRTARLAEARSGRPPKRSPTRRADAERGDPGAAESGETERPCGPPAPSCGDLAEPEQLPRAVVALELDCPGVDDSRPRPSPCDVAAGPPARARDARSAPAPGSAGRPTPSAAEPGPAVARCSM